MDRFWKSSVRVGAGREESSEQAIRLNATSHSPMPEAEFLAGVKSPRVGPGSILGERGNQRAWDSGVGAEERWPSAGRDEGFNHCKKA